MAGKSKLALVMNGTTDVKGMSETAAKSALTEAMNRMNRGEKKLAVMRENAKVTGEALVHTAEITGTAFLSSMAAGYRGEKGLKVGPVDARLAGVGLQVWGLYDCLMGNGGGHQLAIGTGMVTSYIAEKGHIAGAALAEIREDKATAAAASGGGDTGQGLQLQMTPISEPEIKGAPREILLDPATEGRRPHRPQRRRPHTR